MNCRISIAESHVWLVWGRVAWFTAVCLGCFGYFGSTRVSFAQEPAVELDAAAKAAEARLRAILPADSEAMAMLEAIVQGQSMTRQDGWFKTAISQSKYPWESQLSRYDQDDDGQISRVEFAGDGQWFAALDRNGDGVLSREDHQWNVEPASGTLRQLLQRLDGDDDGRITRDEFQRFGDGLLSQEQDYWSLDELRRWLDPPPRVAGVPAERPTPSQLMIGLEKQEIGSHLPGPNVGEIAMDFTLKTLDGQAVTLSQRCSEKPVVLIFGNFTCGPFRAEAGNLERLYERYGEQFHFLVVYVREAHPSDGWAMRRNEAAEIVLPQPQKYEERSAVAKQCRSFMGDRIPLVVDEMDDPVGREYSGMPSRLYLLDADRQVLFKSGRGPHYFRPSELEEALLWHLTAAGNRGEGDSEPTRPENESPNSGVDGGSGDETLSANLQSDAAWRKLGVQFPRLPLWATRLAETLPESTLALLELDYRHRRQNPLGAVQAAKLRWIVADALGSSYGRQAAEFDLRGEGWSDEELSTWARDWNATESVDREVLQFARQLTVAGHAVTDEAVTRLLRQSDAETVVAVVHTVAFANFQNRLFFGISDNVSAEDVWGAIQPPTGWRTEVAPELAARRAMEEASQVAQERGVVVQPLGWGTSNVPWIKSKLTAQTQRSLRVPLPELSRLDFLPEEERLRSEKVIWSRVSLGYQPELTQGWFKLMRTFRRESELDRVFSNSMFWVVTRTNECFY